MHNMASDYRTEKDVMGSVRVPKKSYYGIQVARAARNFPISGMKIAPVLNESIIQIKMAAAQANMQSGNLGKKEGNAIVRACKKIIEEHENFSREFIVDVYQAGAGTPWHMNVNEVIANVALEISGKRKGFYSFIDPHNHVNMSQSSNDVMPSSLRIAALKLVRPLLSELKILSKTLQKKASSFKGIKKTGRTHMMDAVPITLGQEFVAWKVSVESAVKKIKDSSKNLHGLSLGGTAIGTGLNTPKNFDKEVARNLSRITSIKFLPMKSKPYGIQFMTDFLDLSSALRSLSVDLTKIANDIRLLSSGPNTGLNELALPQVEPGSSIMPSKFNPSIPEMLNMICYQVMGNDVAIKEASASGQLELNFMLPLIAHNLIQSLEIFRNGIKQFTNLCVKGIEPNKKVLRHYYETSLAIGAVLNPIVGYDKAAELIKESLKENKPIKELAIERKILSRKQADRLFR